MMPWRRSPRAAAGRSGGRSATSAAQLAQVEVRRAVDQDQVVTARGRRPGTPEADLHSQSASCGFGTLYRVAWLRAGEQVDPGRPVGRTTCSGNGASPA